MKKTIFSICIAILLILLFTYMFTQAGNYLAQSDILEKSDVVVVLAGDVGRVEHGLELMKKGLAVYIIFSGFGSPEDSSEQYTVRQQAVEAGIPGEKIIMENKANSTLTNGTYCIEIIKKYNFRSAIIVTSDYHMRRSRLVFNSLLKGSGVSLIYSASKSENYNAGKWWTDSDSFAITKVEYLKLVGYGLLYGLWFK